MSETLRTFIAIDILLPPSLREVLNQLNGLGSSVKIVDAISAHVTLKFLGETPPDVLPNIVKSVEGMAGECEDFELELVGLGAFPHWGRPTVVWVGLSPQPPLKRMAERLETELEPLGFAKETRAYHPHLTLARIKAKPPRELKPLAETHAATSFGKQTIDEVILYHSLLQKHGPVYTPLAKVPLG